jgi:hypothetical protein
MKRIPLILSSSIAILAAAPAFAGAYRFTYVYEVTTSPPGDVEVENWVTWKTRMPDDRAFNQVDPVPYPARSRQVQRSTARRDRRPDVGPGQPEPRAA